MAEREIIYEFRRVGNATKASAVDVETGIEVCVVGPANAPELALREAARRKLGYVLRRQARSEGRSIGKRGRGTVV
ncbi:MAG: hypothetical protein FJX57_15265 [Alphaproteobacteria bacterium]|nr:hypothetical protein [Alphaproteobacteria bacterium]